MRLRRWQKDDWALALASLVVVVFLLTVPSSLAAGAWHRHGVVAVADARRYVTPPVSGRQQERVKVGTHYLGIAYDREHSAKFRGYGVTVKVRQRGGRLHWTYWSVQVKRASLQWRRA